MIKVSREFWRNIKCIPDCANCCGDCSKLENNKTCSVHPEKLGVSRQVAETEHGRGMGCHASPIELFTYGHYCPPIAKKLEELGAPTIEHHTEASGGEVITYIRKVLNETRKLRGFE